MNIHHLTDDLDRHIVCMPCRGSGDVWVVRAGREGVGEYRIRLHIFG